ncbi:3'-5' exonuclease [Arthrobacter antibioticus]|uniref:exonuclease domain-containing protein n=1 Tax=Arthrobacter sp. H35-MC1 TaxID=3046203 RepID=UPI0024B8E36B|nr:exonuclease domain-containing protein [Arthrobacter sp. H35-MC1]MDJ0316347.1 exonuclease domain-containing protein [Arthrobacter sp. H35-MC1]
MALDFTAIDFETANGFRGSPCSVGLTKVRGGVVVDEGYWLMRPPEGHDHFDSRNISIHGITPDAVASSPRFAAVFPEVQHFIGHDALVAHNAAFDIGVIRSAAEVSGMPAPAFDYACTVILSRKNYSLPSYSLPFVAEAAGVPLLNHHDAVEDARACAGIMVDIAAKHEVASIRGVFESMKLAMPRIEAYNPQTDQISKATRSALAKIAEMKEGLANGTARNGRSSWSTEGPNPVPNPEADVSHPLFGQTLVFTGDIGLGRPEAKIRAAGYGAQCASSVTLKTTVLVVGSGFTATDLRSGRLTSKAQRVLELQRRGQGIEVLSEGEFMQMIG